MRKLAERAGMAENNPVGVRRRTQEERRMGVVCIGECMVELRQAGEGLYARSFAGDAYNTVAVYLKRSAPRYRGRLAHRHRRVGA